MPGRALLIGACDYGEGFVSLPAARRDVQLMKRTLEARGFEVQVASEEVVGNASNLDSAINAFCAQVHGEVGIVYFSGHGVSVGDQDWLLPSGVSRAAAMRSATNRVSTDLTSAADEGSLVILMVDACRDEQDQATSKGGRTWSHGKLQYENKKFIRLFGCGEGQLCHVWRGGDNGQDISVFTAALAKSLAPEAPTETLRELLEVTASECARIALKANPKLPVQRPSIGSFGDINIGTLDQLTAEPVFRRQAGSPGAPAPAMWEAFDPARLHCLVIESEHAALGLSSTDPLRAKVGDVFLDSGERLWAGFRRYWSARRLVDGTRRPIAEAYDPASTLVSALSLLDVFKNKAALEAAIRTVVQADIAFFDVTRFEPGVLFLLGVRAAARRGLTICTHGQGWREGQQLETPFNLSDLQVFSNSDAATEAGEDPVVRRLVDAVERGFAQMALQPRYLDLPAYDSLRELGPDLESWATIPWQELVLTLCSFRPEHRNRWKYVRRGIETALRDRGDIKARVRRLIDLGSSQLVSQSLYEHIRRVAGCVMDWSQFSPSTFMELGVRLACSPWGALQVIDERFLPGGELAARALKPDGTPGPELTQVALMKALLNPRPYTLGAVDTFGDVAEALATHRPFDDRAPAYNWVYSVVGEAIEPVSLSTPPVQRVLSDAARSLLSDAKERDRRELTQALFNASTRLKKDREDAALECRIAAWLYLEHRLMKRSDVSDEDKALHLKLGEDAAAALYDGGADDFALAEEILRRIGKLT